jgi:hypothetical protein
MSAVNTGKVLVGGLLAGLVYNGFDIATGMVLMGDEFRANAKRLGLDPAAMESGASMAVWIAIDFLLGLLVVWTYAAIRPRFGPGPRTAIFAALVPYVAISLMMFGMTHGGMITMSIWMKMTAISLISMSVGAILGAWAYHE